MGFAARGRSGVVVAALCAALGACGGGGGTGASPSSGTAPVGTPAPAPPATTPAPTPTAIGKVQASRFLSQATFGATLDELNALAPQTGYDDWFARQRSAAVSLELPYLQQLAANGENVYQNQRQDIWWRNAVTGPDQLRQRMAFALSEILVVSDASSALDNEVNGLGAYYDLLATDALGNFRTLLQDVTLSTEMGRYLSMLRNDKPDAASGRRADENYARESMQLFTIGLYQLNADGTRRLDGSGNPIPSYTQADVENLARVYTGWAYARQNPGDGDFQYGPEMPLKPMEAYESHHDTAAKTLVGGIAVPAGGSAAADLKIALDTLFNHPNTAPFISRQLIQRLVTSNPSNAYVARVAAVFADNGQGTRGDLFAVARAILTDDEAVNGASGDPAHFGKLREPLVRAAHLWRAFHAVGKNGRYDYWNPETPLSQAALRANSVFNFFRPDYQPPGALTQSQRVCPECQITNESSATLLENELLNFAGLYKSSAGLSNGGDFPDQAIVLDFTPWEAKAADPASLLDDLNLVFLAGRMSAAMKQALVDDLSNIPATQPAQRLSEAVALIVGSPQYALQQ